MDWNSKREPTGGNNYERIIKPENSLNPGSNKSSHGNSGKGTESGNLILNLPEVGWMGSS